MTEYSQQLTNLSNEARWSFDNNFLIDTIKKGEEQLKSKELSRSKRKETQQDIETFKRYINGDFELQSENNRQVRLPKQKEKFKDYILKRMIKQYKTLGDETIKYIINLYEEEIFTENDDLCYETTELLLDYEAELIIKNYEKNSPKFLIPAKKIILDNSIKQIQSSQFASSYCHCDSITEQPYIIINPEDIPCIFNHEVEHAIEYLLGYSYNQLYGELGPIFYEMLFNEELYKKQGFLKSGDYYFRISEMYNLLDIVSSYFEILLLFKESNFDLSTEAFFQTFIDKKSINPSHLEDYLKEEIANEEILNDMCYLFSTLKAIELREQKINTPNNNNEILEPYITSKKFNFSIPKDGFKVYERYIEDMSQKVKRKKQ